MPDTPEAGAADAAPARRSPHPVSVSVIIPTTAEAARSAQLARCIDTIRGASVAPVRIIAVVNGARADQQVCDWLARQPDVTLKRVAKPSAPNAVLEGRKLVDTPFFSTLDDDDEYLPGALDARLAAFAADDTLDIVISNSCFPHAGRDHMIYQHLGEVARDPLAALFVKNWLNSGNALYRARSIGVDDFANPHSFVEWTWLAFKFSIDKKRIAALAQATHRIHGTEGSLSVSQEYAEAYLPLFERMLAAGVPAPIRRLIARRKSAALHELSARALRAGQWRAAAMSHLHSMVLPGGLKYASFTRHLVTGARAR